MSYRNLIANLMLAAAATAAVVSCSTASAEGKPKPRTCNDEAAFTYMLSERSFPVESLTRWLLRFSMEDQEYFWHLSNVLAAASERSPYASAAGKASVVYEVCVEDTI